MKTRDSVSNMMYTLIPIYCETFVYALTFLRIYYEGFTESYFCETAIFILNSFCDFFVIELYSNIEEEKRFPTIYNFLHDCPIYVAHPCTFVNVSVLKMLPIVICFLTLRTLFFCFANPNVTF